MLAFLQLRRRETVVIVTRRKGNRRMLGSVRLHDRFPAAHASAAPANLRDQREAALRCAKVGHVLRPMSAATTAASVTVG